MEPALIAATASLVASISSLIIARQARATGERLKIIEANLADQKEAHARLRIFLRSCEEMRILCWNMLDHVEDAAKLQERYGKKIDDLDVAWAELKFDIPSDSLDFIRQVRHDAWAPLKVVSGYVQISSEEDLSPEERDEYFDITKHNLVVALDKLNVLSSMVVSLKNEIYLNTLTDKLLR